MYQYHLTYYALFKCKNKHIFSSLSFSMRSYVSDRSNNLKIKKKTGPLKIRRDVEIEKEVIDEVLSSTWPSLRFEGDQSDVSLTRANDD